MRRRGSASSSLAGDCEARSRLHFRFRNAGMLSPKPCRAGSVRVLARVLSAGLRAVRRRACCRVGLGSRDAGVDGLVLGFGASLASPARSPPCPVRDRASHNAAFSQRAARYALSSALRRGGRGRQCRADRRNRFGHAFNSGFLDRLAGEFFNRLDALAVGGGDQRERGALLAGAAGAADAVDVVLGVARAVRN